MQYRRIFFLWIITTGLAFFLIIGGKWTTDVFSATEEPYYQLRLFTEVLSLVKKNYVEEVNDKDLIYGAIKGMLNSLDPHSAFMTPEMYKEMQIDTKGEFGGLGIQIGMKDNVVTVIAPIEDTPAYRIGIKAGDKILKIDNQSTKDMSLQEAVSKLRGPKGTTVSLTIYREAEKLTRDYSIVRDIIIIKSVKSKMMDKNIGYVKLTQFQEKTAEDLAEHLKEISQNDIKALILDLRNNPGGLLNISIDVASQFLPSGKLVVYTKNREGQKVEYKTNSDNPHYQFPIVVLVNEGSASASEIVAGALKDLNRAVILGDKTFGKGSVQTVIPLSDGAGLRLTTAKYYTPNGTSIQATGITPDILVQIKPKDKEGKKSTSLREKDLKGHLQNEQTVEEKAIEQETFEETPPLSEEDDIQLQRALDLLKSWSIFKRLQEHG